MGWTSYCAPIQYKNGKPYIDRKAECDKLFNDIMVSNSNEKIGEFKVLKSSMVGSTYYAAVKRTKFATETEPEDSIVFAAICLTSTNLKDYYNFSYKDMDETCGPYKYDCPKGILDLLTPTDSEWANNWRQKCYENLKKKKDPNALSSLPVGTVIKVIMPFDTKYHKQGQEVTLTKCKNWKGNRTGWYKGSMKFTRGLMKLLEDDYEIVRKAVGNI